jgi:hypothetical protein
MASRQNIRAHVGPFDAGELGVEALEFHGKPTGPDPQTVEHRGVEIVHLVVEFVTLAPTTLLMNEVPGKIDIKGGNSFFSHKPLLEHKKAPAGLGVPGRGGRRWGERRRGT